MTSPALRLPVRKRRECVPGANAGVELAAVGRVMVVENDPSVPAWMIAQTVLFACGPEPMCE